MRDRFNQVSARITAGVGSPVVLAAAFGLILLWALSGPFFGFSEGWQLVINTSTTIITFLMVFVIQASQNRDSKALHLKLDEVIRAVHGARNELIAAEQSDEAEISDREQEFLWIAERASGAARRGVADPGDEPVRAAKRVANSPPVRAATRVEREAGRVEREAGRDSVKARKSTPAKRARRTAA